MTTRSDAAQPSIAFVVGEVPCQPFILTLVNGISESRIVYVFGADREEGDDGFASNVIVEKWPRSRLRRSLYVLQRLPALARLGIGPGSRLWRYSTRKGWRRTLDRLVYALPLLIHRPRLVHVQWAKALRRVIELRELYSFSVVLSLRGTHITSSPLGDPELRRSYQIDFPEVNGFHAVCRAIKDDAVRLGAPAERVSVIYSGADEELVAQELKPLNENLVPLRILSVGRIHWKKGYHWALDAIAELSQSHQLQYRIIAGTPSEELRWQVSELGIENQVQFVTRMPRDDVLNEMRHNADVLLVPSVDEGIANVAVEAMAVGLPVIATRCAGMPELISDGETGLLCDVWSQGSISRVLRTFANMTLVERERLRQNARAFVEEHRTVGNLLAQMNDLYDRSISRELDCERT